MIARLQQLTLALALAFAIAWAIPSWGHPLLAAGGALLIACGYALLLAIQFVLLHQFGQNDPTPKASPRQLAGAWWGELIVALKVFCWRQPFRSSAIRDRLPAPDSQGTRPGVVLIHGFFCNRGLWTPWLQILERRETPFIAVNLEPAFGSIDEYTACIERAVSQMATASKCPPVLVCHSMGGLAARAWLRRYGGRARIQHLVTIGTPHHGTWLGHLSRATNGQQMSLGSNWLNKLAQDESAQKTPPTTCWYSNCDNIVFPPKTATLEWADNRLVSGVAHVHLAFHRQVLEETLAIIDSV